jgi:hypothetical protein
MFSLGMFFPWANALVRRSKNCIIFLMGSRKMKANDLFLNSTAKGSVMGVIVSLAMTLFLGIGSIIAGNDGKLPNQKLSLRTDGCYLNETDSYDIDQNFLRTNVAWKEQDYPGLDNIFAMSYLWQPLIPVVGTVVFGLIFSAIVNLLRKTDPTPVKTKYMTPIILSMWVKLLGRKRLTKWIRFEDDEDVNGNGFKKETYGLGSIPRATLTVLIF